ncbi:hypothetical protein [Cynomolgus macaque cytomegalovirus strain Mauritius]|uniref:Uncharacterized protein n=1 Tax=Cynomolgus macaque cytomegalovirus strain Mauritius TaxID=1690255 RepID=A0A0K1H059_9BETA|nr:hypothetical protein [Cynomolgus macaque cytomegalovirus strain Mauritius]AXG21911.1 hypothetical protein [synthetic construct]AXG22180.1 hypothetical protein [synthetic construct]
MRSIVLSVGFLPIVNFSWRAARNVCLHPQFTYMFTDHVCAISSGCMPMSSTNPHSQLPFSAPRPKHPPTPFASLPRPEAPAEASFSIQGRKCAGFLPLRTLCQRPML